MKKVWIKSKMTEDVGSIHMTINGCCSPFSEPTSEAKKDYEVPMKVKTLGMR